VVATTHKTILAIGLLLLVAGFFVLDQGTEIVYPIADLAGLVSHVPTQTPLIAPTLISIASTNHTQLSTDLQGGVQVQGVVTVSGAREIAFYVMNEASYMDWRAGRPTTIILAKPFTSIYNFTLTPTSTGTYYFVFDNQESSRVAVVFSLNLVKEEMVPSPAIVYLGPELILIGILLAIIGVITGKKKTEADEEEAIQEPAWRCKFCGNKNPYGEMFCKKCGRSKE
jgi:hypothetical protein